MFWVSKKKDSLEKNFSISQIEEMGSQPYHVKGEVDIEGKKFQFHDAVSFYITWNEIVRNKMYEFDAPSRHPLIIDCGANMGLSVYYFSRTYPDSKIIAFEPEPPIFDLLLRNIKTFELSNVSAYQKAVWDSETSLDFYTDYGMGGSVTNVYKKQKASLVQTVRLADYLDQKVDMLKVDIEGAEYQVLIDCAAKLKNVNNLFVEYHSFINKEQRLSEILMLLKEGGFRYHLKESFSRKKPLVDRNNACENMDMAINIFAYKE